MKEGWAIVLRIVIVFFGFGVLTFMLWEPHLEVRNAHATAYQIYFNDPFLAYAYVGSIPFFVALFQAFKVLTPAGQNRMPSQAARKALRTIQYCATSIIGFVAVGELALVFTESEDRAGGVFIGILIAVASIIGGAVAAVSERRLQKD